jgi:hypothetical protein
MGPLSRFQGGEALELCLEVGEGCSASTTDHFRTFTHQGKPG